MKQQIMGVLNVTPDSFYDGGQYFSLDKAFARACEMIAEGVDILDLGGESTRPATSFHESKGKVVALDEDEEQQRIFPLLKRLRSEFPSQNISVDTRKVSIAEQAIALGVHMINCVCENISPDMAKLIASSSEVSFVLCHMRGNPQTMQNGDFHTGPMIPYLKDWFLQQIALLKKYGVKESQIILDPGIGFGKRKPDQDFEILRGLAELKALGFPLLIGLSRKSFMGQVLKKPASELLPATLALNAFALQQGADIIRVHDVKEHKDLVQILVRLR